MPWQTLIDPETLATLLHRREVAVVDCRFRLDDTAWGRGEYLHQHIPGAAYADLDADLSGPKTGTNGRHPLPDPDALRATFGRLGITTGVQVVAYDQDSAMYASRLWWLLRWMGHRAVAVLDGGFTAWRQDARATRSGPESVEERRFVGSPDPSQLLTVDAVADIVRHRGRERLLDARAPERFRGDAEPLDRAAGHIPGAANHFFRGNLDEHGRFLSRDVLRARLMTPLGDTPPDQVVAYCGSGVTACHNLLAMEHAGLTGARLYPGSWSEWSSNAERPIATGD